MISSGDSHFVVPTAISIARRGDANVDEYRSQFREAPWAIWETNGHAWSAYPIGVPFLIAPLTWTADRVVGLFGGDLEADAIRKSPMYLELLLSSLITAVAATLLFVYIRRKLSLGKSIVLGLFFALGTSAYSSSSRGMWQHGPSMLLLIAAVLIFDRLDRYKLPGVLALGFLTGYSYAVRSANIVVILGFAVLVTVLAKRNLLPYIGGVLLGVAPLFAFHLSAFGTWFSHYYRLTQGGLMGSSLPLEPLMAILFSPSRGLFVFSPFLLFLVARCWPTFWRKYKLSPLDVLMLGLFAASCVGTARWYMWWGGGSYGPRLLCDALPALVILLIPVVREMTFKRRGLAVLTVLFNVAGVLSILIHSVGATVDAATQSWNATPAPIDQHPYRVWSWKDPQFLRGVVTFGSPAGSEKFVAPKGATPLLFYAVIPCRLVDTRSPAGPFGGPGLSGQQPRDIPVPDGSCNIPRGAAAYSLNFTVIPQGPLGWLNAWATGQPMPSVSILNALTGALTTNAAIVRTGTGGSITVVATSPTELIIDINGYFAPAAASGLPD